MTSSENARNEFDNLGSLETFVAISARLVVREFRRDSSCPFRCALFDVKKESICEKSFRTFDNP